MGLSFLPSGRKRFASFANSTPPAVSNTKATRPSADVYKRQVEYHYNQHLGLLLIYELPDTVKQKVTEAEAYSTVWDIQMKLQHALPRSVVYYGQDTLCLLYTSRCV